VKTGSRSRSRAFSRPESQEASPERGTYAKLKPGPGRSREAVGESQRARLHGALTQLVAQHGFAGVTVRALARTAGVSTRTFYAQYSNLEECFAATYRAIMAMVATGLTEVTEESADWEDGLRRSIRTLADAAVAFPEAASLATIDAFEGGPAMLHQTSEATAEVERRLVNGRRRMQPLVAQAIVAGVESIVGARLLDHREAELPKIADELGDWAIRVHTGAKTEKGESQKLPRPVRAASTREDPTLLALRSIAGDRGRILAAVARLSGTIGYWGITPAAVRRDAGVSRRQFEALFESITDSYLQVIEELFAVASIRVRSKRHDPSESWPERVDRFAQQVEAEIGLSAASASLAFREILFPGREGFGCRKRLIERAADWLRAEAPAACKSSVLEAEATVASAWRTLQTSAESTGRGSMQPPALVGALILAASSCSKRPQPSRVKKHCAQTLD
jgi:AcrR family transcriptional regulator